MGRLSNALLKLMGKVTPEGTESSGKSKADILDTIAENYQGGGGSSLPEVTAEDNGRVLKVVEGAWNKGEDSGIPEAPMDNHAYARLNGEWFWVNKGSQKYDGTVHFYLEDDSLNSDMTVADYIAQIGQGKKFDALLYIEELGYNYYLTPDEISNFHKEVDYMLGGGQALLSFIGVSHNNGSAWTMFQESATLDLDT